MSKPTFLAIAAVICTALSIGACDKTPVPASAPPPQPTPVLNSITETCAGLGTGAPLGIAYLSPKAAHFEIDSTAPKGARDEAIQWLGAHQAEFDQIAEISRKTLEELPPDPPLEQYEKSPAWWLSHLSNVLLADAAWQYDNGKPEIAAKRIATNLRLGIGLSRQKNRQRALGAGRAIAQSCYRLDAIAKDGGFKTVSGGEIRESLRTLDPIDPIGILGEWETSAHDSIASYRKDYSGFGAGKKLAKQFEDFGIILPEVDSLPATGQERIMAIMPRKSAATHIKSMSAGELGKKFDEAEALVTPISEAVKKNDRSALNDLGNRILKDDSQILRMIIGSGITLPDLNSLFTDAVKSGKAAAERMAP